MVKPTLLSVDDHARVSAAVAAAEAGSDGEIATMVARQSDSYADWALVLATMLSFASLAAAAVAPGWLVALLQRAGGGWNADFSQGEVLAGALTVQLLVFTFLWLLLRWMPLRLALTPSAIRMARVRKKAVRAFRMGIEARTRAQTGVLIYLSLAEHRAEIVGDAAINARVSADDWAEAMSALVSQVRAGRAGDGLVEAVNLVGALLVRHFPRSHDDTNEMPDRLIEL